MSDFNPRSPHGERLNIWHLLTGIYDFNPRSPHGERPDVSRASMAMRYFNPRSPHGERRNFIQLHPACGNFNPRSPHGERLLHNASQRGNLLISIHAPRTGSDGLVSPVEVLFMISIHAPRTGSDYSMPIRGNTFRRFQSTLPARGATKRF